MSQIDTVSVKSLDFRFQLNSFPITVSIIDFMLLDGGYSQLTSVFATFVTKLMVQTNS